MLLLKLLLQLYRIYFLFQVKEKSKYTTKKAFQYHAKKTCAIVWMTLVQAVTSLVLNVDPINVDMNAGKSLYILHKSRGEVKVKAPQFRFQESLPSTAILKKFGFLCPFSRPLGKLKKSCIVFQTQILTTKILQSNQPTIDCVPLKLNLKNELLFFNLYLMQLFSADSTIFLKK